MKSMNNVNSICILCGSTNRSVLYTNDEWKVYKCEGCGLGILDPHPEKDELKKLYAETYFQSHYDDVLSLTSTEMKKRLNQENHRLRFFRKFKKRGKILDIGCGRGYFLLACRQAGYEVEGIDISSAAADYVSSELKIPVHLGEVDNLKLSAESYDVITLWHSLEHTSDPNSYIQMAHLWLKENGILVIDVPNHEGYDARKAWSKWPQWDLPFHFHHFTPRSLAKLLEKHRFEIIRRKSYLSEYVKAKLQKAAIPGAVARIVAQLYSGGSYAVIARKKD